MCRSTEPTRVMSAHRFTTEVRPPMKIQRPHGEGQPRSDGELQACHACLVLL